MGKIYGYYEFDESLTPGRSEDGGLSQLLFDSEGKLSDHASFHPTDPDVENDPGDDSTPPHGDSDPNTDARAAALLILAVIGAGASGYVLIRKATPHVQRMIHERTLPAVRSFWKKVRGPRSEADVPDPDETSVAAVQTPPAHAEAAAPKTILAIAKPQMSPDEWYARFRAMFEASKFADEQWKLLSTAQVADDNAIAELQREMARSHPQVVVRRVTLMLEATPEIAFTEAEPTPSEVERDPGQHP